MTLSQRLEQAGEQPDIVGLCPNPWCASHRTRDPEIRDAERPILMPSRASYEWCVACPVCPIQTPWFDTEQAAAAEWNAHAERELAAAEAMKAACLKALRTAQYDPAPYTKGKYAIEKIDVAAAIAKAREV